MSEPTFMSHQARSNGALPVSVAVAQLAKPESVADGAIATRAYEKFVARGCVHGRDEEDWAAAKTELMAEASAPKS